MEACLCIGSGGGALEAAGVGPGSGGRGWGGRGAGEGYGTGLWGAGGLSRCAGCSGCTHWFWGLRRKLSTHRRRGKSISDGRAWAPVPLRIRAALAPWHPSYAGAGAGNALHELVPMTAKFGGCSPPQMMWHVFLCLSCDPLLLIVAFGGGGGRRRRAVLWIRVAELECQFLCSRFRIVVIAPVASTPLLHSHDP